MRKLTTLLLAAAAIATAQLEPVSVSTGSVVYPGRAPRRLPTAALDALRSAAPVVLPELSAADVVRRGRRGMPRPGRNRAVPRALDWQWRVDPSGDRVWVAAVRSLGAKGLRLHFSEFDLSSGELWIHDGNGAAGQPFGPYTARGDFGDGDFWTELVFQDTVYLEYRVPGASPAAPPTLRVPEVYHLWQDLEPPQAAGNFGCFLDATCYLSHSTVDTFSKGAAFLLFEDHACSGTFINDRNNTGTPYLLTAGHCIDDESDARSMLAVLNFRTNACNGVAQLPVTYPQVRGSVLLARDYRRSSAGEFIAPDFAFVRLVAPPSVSWNAIGWSASIGPADRLTSVSHPRGLPQRLAAGSMVGSNENFYYVRMFQGAVDQGSSGSGLITDANYLIGVDSHGPATPENSSICDVSSRDFGYTRFSVIYPRISSWLEAAPPPARAAIISPQDRSTLSGASVFFSWNLPAGATGFSLAIGSQVGSSDFLNRDAGMATSFTAANLPVDGRLLYVRLTTRSVGGAAFNDYVYSAATSRPANVPVIQSRGVVSAASGLAVVGPGSWATAFGANLGPAPGRAWSASEFAGANLPLVVAGTRVTVNGRPAAVSFVSPTQVNFQVPDDSTSGPVPVVVTTSAGASVAVTVELRPAPVALFQSGQDVIATHLNGAAVTRATAPARPGEVITLWGTACGATNPFRPSGVLIAPAPLAGVVSARVGGVAAPVVYAGLAGPGLCQFNISVPSLPDGVHAVNVSIAGSASQANLVLPVRAR